MGAARVSMKALAVDLGGSHAACAIVDDVAVLARRTLPLPPGAPLAAALPALTDAMRSVLAETSTPPSACLGVAFGFPGVVDGTGMRVTETHRKYDDAPALDLRAWARDAFYLPLALENDARLALLGERHAGAARGCDDVVMMTLGTGIGGVAMVGGRLLRGRRGRISFGGHLQPIEGGRRRCACGLVGCPESEGSGWALPDVVGALPGFAASALAHADPLDFRTLFAAAAAGDGVAAAAVEHSIGAWCVAAAGMANAYDPEVLVVGGGVMGSADVVLPRLAAGLRAKAIRGGDVDVRPAALGNDAALLGALPLLRERAA